MPVHKLVSYGFLYDGYSISRGLFWWEVLVLGRKCAVVALASFVSSQFVQVRRRSGGVTSACLTGLCFPSPQQMFLATILIVTALMLHLGLRPYESMSLHRLESVSLLVSALVSVRSCSCGFLKFVLCRNASCRPLQVSACAHVLLLRSSRPCCTRTTRNLAFCSAFCHPSASSHFPCGH